MSGPFEIHHVGSIGERIRTARKEAGLSQADLAKKLGVSQPAIATWESGVHDPRRLVIAKLADALKVSIEWLAAGARSTAEADAQAAAAYLRRGLRHVPVISLEAAVQFATDPDTDPHALAEDYIPVTAGMPNLFAVFIEDPAVDLAFPVGSLVVVDYEDRAPTDGGFCLAAVGGAAIVRRMRSAPARLEPCSTDSEFDDELMTDRVTMIGCVRVSIRFH